MKITKILFGAVMIFTTGALTAAETYSEAWAKGLEEYKAGKYGEAAAALDEAVKLAKTPKEKWESMCQKGYALRNLRKFAEAAELFGEVVKIEGLSPVQKDNAFSQYLNAVYSGKKYDDVISIAEKTVADDKASGNMKTTSAFMACQSSNALKKYDVTIKWAKKLQELNPKSCGFVYQAQALRSQKKYKEAEEILNKDNIAQMSSKNQLEAYFELGHIKAAQKKYDESAAEFVKAYELSEANSGYKDVAVIYVIENLTAVGKPEDAQVWLERVDTVKNKYWKARGLMNHAKILQKQGKLKEAKEKLEECKKTGPWYQKEADNRLQEISILGN